MKEEQDLGEQLEVLVGRLLASSGQTLAVAESCTGGLLGSLLTDVPGSSEYFLGGVIAYHDRLKMELLGVSKRTIVQYGAVSMECALEMARGVRSRTQAGIGVAITGIAGPTGGTTEKPVGTVYISLVSLARDYSEITMRYQWQGDRLSNKRESAEAALRMIVEHFEG